MSQEHESAQERPDDRGELTDPGLGRQIRTDLNWLHTGWMGLVFPRQLDPHPVQGRWEPSTVSGRIGYRLWGTVGLPVVAVAFVLAVVGFAVRFHSRRLFRVAKTLGYLGVLLVTASVWGTLVAGTYLLSFPVEGVLAVAAGGAVAAVSAVVAVSASRWDGRVLTVVVGFPFGVTALFLPPVAAAMFSPTLAQWVLPSSYELAVWLLDNVLSVGGLAAYLRVEYQLVGVAYLAMWFGLAIPVGWVLGSLVTLADYVRPAPPETGV